MIRKNVIKRTIHPGIERKSNQLNCLCREGGTHVVGTAFIYFRYQAVEELRDTKIALRMNQMK